MASSVIFGLADAFQSVFLALRLRKSLLRVPRLPNVLSPAANGTTPDPGEEQRGLPGLDLPNGTRGAGSVPPGSAWTLVFASGRPQPARARFCGESNGEEEPTENPHWTEVLQHSCGKQLRFAFAAPRRFKFPGVGSVPPVCLALPAGIWEELLSRSQELPQNSEETEDLRPGMNSWAAPRENPLKWVGNTTGFNRFSFDVAEDFNPRRSP